jgi:hypothetical protein
MAAPAPSAAQDGGDVAAAWGGGALGALSGVGLGLVGAALPCSLTFRGARCARVAASVGGLIGSAGGAVLAYHDADALRARVTGAGIGAAAGLALGIGAHSVVRQVELADVVTLAVTGAAIGAAPVGAGVGLGAGLLAGSALWLLTPEHGLPETLAMGVVGMALGGLMQWAHAAVAAADQAPSFVARVSLRF